MNCGIVATSGRTRPLRTGSPVGPAALLLAVALLAPVACGGAPSAPAPTAEMPAFRVVTSFYPIQIMALNITADIPGVTVASLTTQTTGCPHDYQLTTEALRTLSDASVLVINGAGMESFLEKIAAQYPSLTVIDASRGIELIPERHEIVITADAKDGRGCHHRRHAPSSKPGQTARTRAEAGDDAAAGAMNPHIWVSVSGAMRQVEAITDGLCTVDPGRAELYRANAARYIAKLEALRSEMHAALDPLPNRRIITFHDAFPWFAHEFNLEIVAVVAQEHGAEPSAGALARIIRTAREKDVRVIFSEPQYSPRAAEVIARETNARVHVLDPAVTGPEHPDAYLEIMRRNLATLREALAS